MRKALVFIWLLLPVAAGAYHYGPGQDRVRADDTARAIERGTEAARTARAIAAKDGDDAARASWTEAEAAFAEALQLLPPNHEREARALRLERDKAQMNIGKLFDARHDLEALVREIGDDPASSAKELDDARNTLAQSQYYATWLMRLEGAPREEWEPEIEAARQNYKLIAEKSAAAGDEQVAALSRENLEAAVRLERMELSDLQGLPLPSQ